MSVKSFLVAFRDPIFNPMLQKLLYWKFYYGWRSRIQTIRVNSRKEVIRSSETGKRDFNSRGTLSRRRNFRWLGSINHYPRFLRQSLSNLEEQVVRGPFQLRYWVEESFTRFWRFQTRNMAWYTAWIVALAHANNIVHSRSKPSDRRLLPL